MGVKFKYQINDIVNDQYKLIFRDYKDNNGNWYCTFECQKCGKIFQTRLNYLLGKKQVKCDCALKPYSDLLGRTKGVFTILKKLPYSSTKRDALWLCRCECGKEFEISTTSFNRRKHEQCPHQNKGTGGRIPSLKAGDKFGKLIIQKYLGNRYWECLCECGNVTKKKTDQLTSRDYSCCAQCAIKSHGEQKLTDVFQKLNIKYEYQKIFETCRFPNTNSLARFDFYLPDYNTVIEYNGIQHYEYRENTSGWDTKENFLKTQYRDNYKIQWCKKNGINLIIIPYTDYKKLNEEYIINILSNN